MRAPGAEDHRDSHCAPCPPFLAFEPRKGFTRSAIKLKRRQAATPEIERRQRKGPGALALITWLQEGRGARCGFFSCGDLVSIWGAILEVDTPGGRLLPTPSPSPAASSGNPVSWGQSGAGPLPASGLGPRDWAPGLSSAALPGDGYVQADARGPREYEEHLYVNTQGLDALDAPEPEDPLPPQPEDSPKKDLFDMRELGLGWRGLQASGVRLRHLPLPIRLMGLSCPWDTPVCSGDPAAAPAPRTPRWLPSFHSHVCKAPFPLP